MSAFWPGKPLGVCIASGPGGKEGQSQTDHYELEQGYAAASPVLENMFDEAFWKSENMIRIFGIPSNAVELFTGELDPNVTAKHIHQVFRQYGILAHARIPGGKQRGFVQLAESYVFRQYGNLAHARIPGGKQCGFVQLAERCTMSSEHRVKIKVKLHPFVLDSCLAMATRTLIIQVCHLQIRCLLFYDCMKILSINARGLGSVDKIDWVKEVYYDVKPYVLAIQETKMDNLDENLVRSLWGSDNLSYAKVDAIGSAGGILTIWDEAMFVNTTAMGGDGFLAVLGSWKGKEGSVDAAWCIFGDFNEVRSALEQKNSNFNKRGADKFNDFIGNGNLIDIPLDKLKNVKEGLRKWGRDKYQNNNSNSEDHKNEATKWEKMAEVGDLDEDEITRWKEARRRWIEKD
ncbi:RNA-directed DNA polymerase, eukaryota [Tanacetum coccineum]